MNRTIWGGGGESYCLWMKSFLIWGKISDGLGASARMEAVLDSRSVLDQYLDLSS